MTDSFLAALLRDSAVDPVAFRVGTVTSTSPLEVNIAGTDGLSANRLASYTPTLNDVVYIAQNSAELVVLDKLVSGG